MKKQTILRSFFSEMPLLLLVFSLGVSSCKKTESAPVSQPIVESPVKTEEVSEESLIKFLSISLGVEKSEITLDKSTNEFFVRGLKFSRTDTEMHYNKANVYQAIYGK
jgi:hypothetical protein